jgi:hypothetical protein
MKNLNQLERKVAIFHAGYGHKKVSIIYRGKEYKHTSTNTQASDRIHSDVDGIDNNSYYKTKKQAYLSLYNECKRANNLR